MLLANLEGRRKQIKDFKTQLEELNTGDEKDKILELYAVSILSKQGLLNNIVKNYAEYSDGEVLILLKYVLQCYEELDLKDAMNKMNKMFKVILKESGTYAEELKTKIQKTEKFIAKNVEEIKKNSAIETKPINSAIETKPINSAIETKPINTGKLVNDIRKDLGIFGNKIKNLEKKSDNQAFWGDVSDLLKTIDSDVDKFQKKNPINLLTSAVDEIQSSSAYSAIDYLTGFGKAAGKVVSSVTDMIPFFDKITKAKDFLLGKSGTLLKIKGVVDKGRNAISESHRKESEEIFNSLKLMGQKFDMIAFGIREKFGPSVQNFSLKNETFKNKMWNLGKKIEGISKRWNDTKEELDIIQKENELKVDVYEAEMELFDMTKELCNTLGGLANELDARIKLPPKTSKAPKGLVGH